MSFETRFTEDEQALFSTLPTLVGSVMTMSAGSGLATVKEMFASSQSLLQGGRDYSANEIISGIVPNMQNFSEAREQARSLRDKMQAHLKEHEIKNQEELRAQVIEDCRKIHDVLAAKATPEEAEDYKNWILNVAENVAKAAKEGGFLGFGGTLVSDQEKAFFNEIAEALQVDRNIG